MRHPLSPIQYYGSRSPIVRFRTFLALVTLENELDVVQHNPAIASQHGAALLHLFTCARRRLSDAAWLSCTKLLAPYGSITAPA